MGNDKIYFILFLKGGEGYPREASEELAQRRTREHIRLRVSYQKILTEYRDLRRLTENLTVLKYSLHFALLSNPSLFGLIIE